MLVMQSTQGKQPDTYHVSFNANTRISSKRQRFVTKK